MPTGTAIVVTLGIAVLIAGFVALATWFGLTPLYAGFLLIWYWGAIDELNPSTVVPLIIGAVGGTALAWLLQHAATNWGPTGLVPVLLLILAAIFCQLKGWLTFLVNRPFMLYLTVMAAPLLQANESFPHVMAAIAAGSVYFFGIVLLGRKIMTARQPA
ncbi:hypothetical protein ACUJ46_09270 [Sandaracinobacteroides sp. A072]|uniref:hypothetical protein n=1 Tax=Sandaracinobacteroides sp. A072 TaxID=3461146 RepID=UPI0040419771